MIKISVCLVLILGLTNCEIQTPAEVKDAALRIFNSKDHSYSPDIASKRRSFVIQFTMTFIRASDDKQLLNQITNWTNGFFENVHNVQFAYNKLWGGPIDTLSESSSESEIQTDNPNIIEYLDNQQNFAVQFGDFDVINHNFTAQKSIQEKCKIITTYNSLVQLMYETSEAAETIGLVAQLFNLEQKLNDGLLESSKEMVIEKMVNRLTRTGNILQHTIDQCAEQAKTCH